MPSRQRNYDLAIRLYQAAVNTGASPTNALALTSFAHAESGFNQTHIGGDPGSPEGMSYGLMQTGGRLYGISNRSGATRSPEAALQFYIGYLQQHQPDLWTQMQSAPDVHGVWQALHNTGAQGFALGRQTDARGQTYASHLSQALTPTPTPASTPLPIDIPPANLHDPYGGYNPAYSPHYPSPLPQPTSIPFVTPPQFPNNVPPAPTPSAIPQAQPSTGQQFYPPSPSSVSPIPVYSPVSVSVPAVTPPIPDPTAGVWEGYTGQPIPSPYAPPNPASTFYNPPPWEEQFSPVDQYSQQPIGTEGLDYEQPWPVDSYSKTSPFGGAGTEFNPFEGAMAGGQATNSVHDFNQANAQYGEGMWFYNSQGDIVPVASPDFVQPPDLPAVGSTSSTPRPQGFGDLVPPPPMPPVEGYTGGFGVGAGPQFGITPAGFSTGYIPFGGAGSGGSIPGTAGGSGGAGPQFSGGGFFDSSSFQPQQGFFGLGGMNAAGGGSMPVGISGPESGIAMRSQGDGGRDSKRGMALDAYLESLPQPEQVTPGPQYISSYMWDKNPGSAMQHGAPRGWWSPQYTQGTGTDVAMPTVRGGLVTHG